MKFECRCGYTYKDGHAYYHKLTDGPFLDVIESPEAKKKVLDHWYNWLRNYTRRSMSDPYDKLTAISSLAHQVHAHLGSEYHYGSWACDWVQGLLWVTTKFGSPGLVFRPGRAPSWSWAAWDGLVICGKIAISLEGNHHSSAIRTDGYDQGFTFERDRTDPKIVTVTYDVFCHNFDPIRDKSNNSVSQEIRIEGCLISIACIPWNTYKDALDGNREKTVETVTQDTWVITGLVEKSDEAPVAVAVASVNVDSIRLGRTVALRLTQRKGHVLVPNSNSTFHRVEVFWVRDLDWFDQQASELCSIALV